MVIAPGAGGVFSPGHDLSPGPQRAGDPLQRYDQFQKDTLDLLLTWPDVPEPAIAMAGGSCIYAGSMLAAARGPLDCAGELAHRAGESVGFPGHPRSAGRALERARRPKSR